MSSIALNRSFLRSFNILKSNSKRNSSNSNYYFGGLLGLSSLASIYLIYNNNNNKNNNNNNNNNGNLKSLFGFGTAATVVNDNIREAISTIKSYDEYQKIYNDIALKLRDEDDYDDGSYGPVLVRLAWHASGTYDKNDKSDTRGGSYGGTMSIKKELTDPANAGLINARNFIDPIGEKYPWLSKGDLYTLGGVVAIQELQGPKIPWRPGRNNLDESSVAPYGRLPDASQETGKYIRSVFDKMGFSDQEVVALIGAHALGRCHTTASGYDGPWTFSPTVFTNQFFVLLKDKKWHVRNWNGPKQFQDDETKSLMMLPADMVFLNDPKYKKYVDLYAKDEQKFFKDFSSAFAKLLELGVSFPKTTPSINFKTLDEQDL